MADLETWSQVAEIVGGATVVAGVAFGALQARQWLRQRRDTAALEILRSYQDEVWTRFVRRIYLLPDHADPRQIGADPELEQAAVYVAVALNGMAYAIHQGTVPRRVFIDWDPDTPRICWRKLDRWVRAVRRHSGGPRVYHWFEWWVGELERLVPAVPRAP